jgi:hypothetical protein
MQSFCNPSKSSMTATGLMLCMVIGSLSIFVPSSSVVPIPSLALITGFLLIERRSEVLNAITSGLLIVCPVAIYLSIVWILIADGPPSSSILFLPSSRSAIAYVAGINLRLLLFVVLLHGALKRAATDHPVRFLAEIRLPRAMKVVIAMTLSITSTMRVSAEKAWASLVAVNLLTPRMSWTNVLHGPLLALAIWVSMVGTVSTRLHTKWLVEDLHARLDRVFSPSLEKPLTIRDCCWVAAALLTAISSIAG